jgi:adenosine deaminase
VPPGLWRDLLVEQGISDATEISIQDDLMNLSPKAGLRAYFRPWTFIRQLSIDRPTVRRLLLAAARPLADDRVEYIELRHSVTHVARAAGVSVQDALSWFVDAADEVHEVSGVDMRFVISLIRHEWIPELADDLVAAVSHAAVNTSRVVGVDVAGDEETQCTDDLERTLQRMRDDVGLRVTVHAGETGHIENVKWALDVCQASRIGHGLAAAADPDLLDRLRGEDICLEVCLTSNFLTGHVPDLQEHPVMAFRERDVPFVLCTDNPQMHAKTLTSEYRLFEELFDDRQTIEQLAGRNEKYSFGGYQRTCAA